LLRGCGEEGWANDCQNESAREQEMRWASRWLPH
jgi:hypothetical protein